MATRRERLLLLAPLALVLLPFLIGPALFGLTASFTNYAPGELHVRLVGLANDELGYIIPKRQWDEKTPFCYGRKEAQYGEANSVGPETAPILCRAFRDLVAGKK